jgi:hypothetical protein
MKTCQINRLAAASAWGLVFLATPSAWASTSILGAYTRTSAVEVLTVPFTSLSVLTAQSYSGPVEMIVSGTGYSFGRALNDAFYMVGGGGPNVPYYALAVNQGAAAGGSPNTYMTKSVRFVEGVGAVNGTAPAYSADHVYHFVFDAGPLSGPLSFAVADGNYWDNGGSFNLQFWQLKEGAVPAVPEASSLAMFALGLLGLGAAARRRQA